MKDSPICTQRGSICGIAAVVLLACLCTSLFAKDPLAMIPADTPCVIVMPKLATTTQQVSTLYKRIQPDADDFCVLAFGEDINLSPGCWETGAPVVLILPRPEFDKSSLVVAFKPKNAGSLIVKAGAREEMPGRCDGPAGPSWVSLRGGMAFAAQKRSALRVVKDSEESRSVADVLDSVERQMLSECDVFVRLNVARWREKILPPMTVAMQMISLGITAEVDPEQLEASQAMIRWFIDGLQTLIEQLDSISLSAKFCEVSLQITHHHRFASGKSVGTYLSAVQHDRRNLLETLPDRPFWMALTSNWNCMPDQSLTTRITEYVMNLEPMKQKMDSKVHERLLKDVRDCYGQMKGSAFMLTSPAGSMFPMEMIGSYVMNDATRGLAQLSFIQENANEAVASMLPGAKVRSSRFKEMTADGKKYSEMSFDLASASPKMRDEVEMVYGPNARYQMMTVDKEEILFCISQPPMNIVELARSRKGTAASLAANRNVQKTIRLLHAEPNLLVLFDADRLLAAVPGLAFTAANTKAGETGKPISLKCDTSNLSQTLVGWSAVAGPGTFTGRLAVSTDDFVHTAQAARKMMLQLKETLTETEAQP